MTMTELKRTLENQEINNPCSLCWREKNSCDCGDYDIQTDSFIQLTEGELQYA